MRPTRPANPMDVILGVHREIVVHHMRDTIHINPPRRDVRRHQHPHRAGLEILQRPQTLALRPIRVDRRRPYPLMVQVVREMIRRVLHANKNQHHVHLRLLEQMQ